MDWMHSRLRVLAPAVGLLLIVAFAFTAAPARAAMSRPAWAAGDFWVYAYSSALTGASTNGTLRMDVTGTESVSVNGTSYPTYHVAAMLTFKFGSSVTFTQPADIWYNSDTLAIVKIAATVDLSFGSVSFKSKVSISGNPPQTIQWPLTAAAQWDSSTTVWSVTTNSTGAVRYMSAPLRTHFEVQADASITVPAGTFTTSPVKETSAGSTAFVINYWSPQAGNSVRTESHNGSSQPGGYNLTSYRYQGGSFFTTVFVGLPVWIWLLVIVLILAAVVGIVVVRRRKPRVGMPPGSVPPQQPPPGMP